MGGPKCQPLSLRDSEGLRSLPASASTSPCKYSLATPWALTTMDSKIFRREQ